jgi:hypothetical protein
VRFPLFRVVRRFADGATGRRDGHSLVPRAVRVVQAYPAMHAACWTRVRATGRVRGRRPPHPRPSRSARLTPRCGVAKDGSNCRGVVCAAQPRPRKIGGLRGATAPHSSTTHTGSWIQAWAAGSRRSVGLYRPSPGGPRGCAASSVPQESSGGHPRRPVGLHGLHDEGKSARRRATPPHASLSRLAGRRRPGEGAQTPWRALCATRAHPRRL